ncbi:hypothetical protein [Methylopila turkensis]|uniref:Uncharacterized protein n=1 Tax=Methylopila turkensis TaxID=1437816 RepID=A0A9W6JTA1_9HYPH|nr:hypothetical protein [Methylopila turkensis]GLK81409.1 hypothetical protein GCM10008174_31500 [Methylopila turkensis]
MTYEAHNTPPPGARAETLEPVEAKQGTNKPKGMPVVLIASIGAAVVAMAVVLFSVV